ncbi:hypothetical protein GCM10007422_17930 [Pedobacter zeae]|uniref:Uncharacterized protein n=2 Tax=Pedobacter zeae TaxID=1737356 RepID=A0ABQ1XTY9_9SPHI|nr:hypothetical protein GCM10007422_17930 [Pedobacter zeae]
MKSELKLLIVLSTMLLACGSLKSKKTLLLQDLQSNSYNQEHHNEQSRAEENTILLDTSNSEYEVRITPLGKFLYSAENGFEGMAEKVVLSGKAGKKRVVQQQRQSGHQFQRQTTRTESTVLKTKAQQVDKSRKSRFGLLAIGLVVVFGLVYWLIKKWPFG